MERDEALALLLIELLFLQHADFVIGGIHTPILDIDVKFGKVEVRADGVSAKDAEALVVAVSDVMGGEPVGDDAFAIGLDQSSAFGSDGFVEFDFGIEVTPVEEDFVEASIAKGALESLLAAAVFLGRSLSAAADAFVQRSF